jgi:glutamate--cysteine ligase
MFFIKREGRLVPMIGTTFREFLEGKSGRFEPTMNDFVLHLSTAFPEIRLKQFVEVRGADGGPRNHMTALPAIWKGILYHEPSRGRAADLLGGIDPEEHADIFLDVYRNGLEARTPEGTVRELAEELLDLSEEGLSALGEEYDHELEVGFLKPLRRIVDSGETLADQLRADIKRYGDDRRSVLEKWSLV